MWAPTHLSLTSSGPTRTPSRASEDAVSTGALRHVSLREALKRSNLLVNAVRSTRRLRYKIKAGYEIVRGALRTNYKIVNDLAAFSPDSTPDGAFRARADLTIQSAQQTFPLILSVAKAVSRSVISPQPIEALFPIGASSDGSAQLAASFVHYGSDKSTVHDYHLVYAALLSSRRSDPLRLLEIGIGTNNPRILSHMGVWAKPGASLRAFRDFCPNAQVFGADIDKNILFEEDRIHTYYVDQTRLDSFDELYSHISDGMFDLVIDDGLHSPLANLSTMLFALKILKPSGVFIVEDITSSKIALWQTVAAILPPNYSPKLIQGKFRLLFMMQKPGSFEPVISSA
jgi:hypothetical protein